MDEEALHARRQLRPPCILRDGRRIATKGQIYDIISEAHVGLGHMGRDKTFAKIKETWSWLPKGTPRCASCSKPPS